MKMCVAFLCNAHSLLFVIRFITTRRQDMTAGAGFVAGKCAEYRLDVVEDVRVECHERSFATNRLTIAVLPHSDVLRQALNLFRVPCAVKQRDVVVFSVLLAELVEECFYAANRIDLVEIEHIGHHLISPLEPSQHRLPSRGQLYR